MKRKLPDRKAQAKRAALNALKRARRMAEPFKGRVIPWEQIYDTAAEADIIVTSTGALELDKVPDHLVVIHQKDSERGHSTDGPTRREWAQLPGTGESRRAWIVSPVLSRKSLMVASATRWSMALSMARPSAPKGGRYRALTESCVRF